MANVPSRDPFQIDGAEGFYQASQFDPSSFANVLNVESEAVTGLYTRAVTTSPDVRNLLAQSAAQDLSNRMLVDKGRRDYLCTSITDQSDINLLQATYNQFNIKSRPGDIRETSANHAYAREERRLCMRLVYEVFINIKNAPIKLQKSKFSGRTYDVLVKDVGGNSTAHINNEYTSTHCCSPVIDTADAVRYGQTREFLRKNGANILYSKKPIATTLKSMLSGSTKHKCLSKSQHCTIRAPIVTFIHSTYNMTVGDIGATLDSAEAITAYAVLHYSPSIHLESSGVLPAQGCMWQKYMQHGKMYIRFCFDDSEFYYVHEYATYMALMRLVRMRTPRGREFVIHRTHVKNGTAILRLELDERNYVPSELVYCHYVLEEERDTMLLCTYKYDAMPDPKFDISVIDHIKPVIIPISKRFFSDVLTYIRGIDSSKMSISKISPAFSAMSSRTSIGNTLVTTTSGIPEEHYNTVLISMYFYVFRENYEGGKLLEALRKEEEKCRSVNAPREGLSRRFLAVLHRFLRACFWPERQTAHGSDTEDHPFSAKCLKMSDVDAYLDNCDFSNSVFTMCKNWTVNHVKRLYRSFVLRAIRRSAFPVEFFEGPRIIQIEEYIPEMFSCAGAAPSSYDEPFIFYPTLKTVFAGKIAWAMDDILSDVESKYPTPSIIRERCEVSERDTEVVPGDGNCFFHSFRRLTNHHEPVEAIRARLSKSRFLSAFSRDDIQNIVTRLEKLPINGVVPEDGWVNSHIISLTCMEYGVSVCIHAGGGDCCVYNSTSPQRIHVKLFNAHYSPIVYRRISSHVSLTTVSNIKYFVDSEPSKDAIYGDTTVGFVKYPTDSYQSAFDIVSDTFGEDLNNATIVSKTHSFHSRLGTFGFDSHYALLLAGVYHNMRQREITEEIPKLYLPKFTHALLVGDKDMSAAQYFADVLHCRTKVVRRIARRDRSPSTNVINSHLVSHVASSTSLDTAIQRLGRDQFDSILINPVFYSDFLSAVENQRHDMHVATSLSVLKKLSVAGTLVVATAAPLTAFTTNLMCRLCGCFDNVEYVVPLNKPAHCVWNFVLCTGFKGLSEEMYVKKFLPFVTVTDSSYKSLWEQVPGSMLDLFDALYSRGLNDLCEAVSDLQMAMQSESTPFIDNSATAYYEGFYPTRSDVHVGGSVGEWVTWVKRLIVPKSQGVPVVSLPPVAIKPFGAAWLNSAFPGVPTRALNNVSFMDSAKREYTKYFIETMLSGYYDRGILSSESTDSIYVAIEKLLSKDELDPRLVHFDVHFLVNYLHYLRDDKYVMFNITSRMFFFDHVVKSSDFLNPIDKLVTSLGGFSRRFSENCELSSYTNPIKLAKSQIPFVTKLPTRNVSDYIIEGKTPNVLAQYMSVCNSADGLVTSSSSLRTAIGGVSTTEPVKTAEGGRTTPIPEDGDGPSALDFEKQVYASGNYIGKTKNVTPNRIHDVYTDVYTEYVSILRKHVENVQGMCDDLFLKTRTLPSYDARSKLDPCRVAWERNNMQKFMVLNDPSSKPVVVREGSVISGPSSDISFALDARYVYVGHGETGRFVKVTKDLPRNFVYFHEMKIFSELDILRVCEKRKNLRFPSYYAGIVQAGPGCGKTHSIVESAKSLNNCLVLTTVREGALSLQEKLEDSEGVTVKTIDSFVMHADAAQMFKYVYIDEAMMAHPGKLLLALELANPNFAFLYGDLFQIPFINRVNTKPRPKFTEVSKTFPIIKVLDVSYRCPRDVVVYLAKKYAAEFKGFTTPPKGKLALRSRNDAVCPSVSVSHIQAVASVPISNDAVYLTFTHPDADALSTHLDRSVKTVHEFQGNQAENIIVVRLTPTPVPIDGGECLFSSEGHVTTAISRHTKSLHYYTVVNANDGITKFWKQSTKYNANDLSSASDF
nr:putative methyltransferase helicase [Ailanthus crinkle leaf associated bluner-like virus]